MRVSRWLLVPLLAVLMLTLGCADPGAEELESAQALTMGPGTQATTEMVVDEASFGDAAADDSSVPTDADTLEANLSGVKETASGNVTGWITVTADEEADGEHTVTVTIGDTERVVPVTVEEPEDPLERGEVGQLVFTARTTDGRLVVSNDANVTDAGYPETAVFRAMGTSGAVPVPLQEGGQFPAELVEVAVGVGIGHSITVPVGELFGGEIVEDTQPRETSVPRELTVPVETSYGARQAQQVLDRDTQEGDEVDLPQEGFRVPYTVETIGQREVTFQLAVEVNETFTLVEPWTDAARVTNTTDGQATIDHDPDVAEGDQLTWVDAWGNVTEVVAVDESIQLRHSPPVGLTYERTDPRSGQTISNEIVELTDDEVRIEQTNPHPLAGEPIIFDVTVIDRGQEGPRTQGPR